MMPEYVFLSFSELFFGYSFSIIFAFLIKYLSNFIENITLQDDK